MAHTRSGPDSRSMDDYAEVIADMRRKLAERGEPAEDHADDELRFALRITLIALAHEYEQNGTRISRKLPR
jgi:hypothetical protein